MTLYCGDALAVLRELPAESIQCCATSPPYWGLRDYGIAPTVWGGKVDCEHDWGPPIPGSNRGGSGTPTDLNNRGEGYGRDVARGTRCFQCGAWRGSLGLEPTPELYVEHLVAVFREVRRVLKADGTLWLNLGDSYCGSWGNSGQRPELDGQSDGQRPKGTDYLPRGGWDSRRTVPPNQKIAGLKPKDLVGIPWRVAFALQADGWWLRSDIIWSKTAPMPESVRDRPTRSHEYMFLFAKSERYYFNQDAVREPHADESLARAKRNRFGGKYIGADPREHGQLKAGNGYGPNGDPDIVCSPGGRNIRSVWTIGPSAFTGWTETSRLIRAERGAVSDGMTRIVSPGCPVHGDSSGSASSVSYDEHGAGLESHTERTACRVPEPQVGSAPIDPHLDDSRSDGSSDSGPPQCSSFARPHSSRTRKMGRAPVTSSACTASVETSSRIVGTSILPSAVARHLGTDESNTWPDVMGAHLLDQTAWSIVGKPSWPIPPECLCGYYHKVTEKTSHFATFPPKLIEPCILAGSKPGDLILDPFNGAGTTGLVALELGRRYIGIDLKPEYLTMTLARLTGLQRRLP